jgi:hypothetical protein
MKHEWNHPNPAPGTKWWPKYFGCVDFRQCKNCGKIQVKEPITAWMRTIGYRWEPLAGRCKGKIDEI